MGMTYLSGTDDILAGVVAQKSFFLGPPRSPLELKLKAHADYNTQTQQVRSSSGSVYCFPSQPDAPSLPARVHNPCIGSTTSTCHPMDAHRVTAMD